MLLLACGTRWVQPTDHASPMGKRRTYSACLSCAFHHFPRRNAELKAVLVQEYLDALASSLSAAAQTHKYLVNAVDKGLFLLPRMAEEHVAHAVRVKAGRFRGHGTLTTPIAHKYVLIFEPQSWYIRRSPRDSLILMARCALVAICEWCTCKSICTMGLELFSITGLL
jgi:hypothetical protein